MQYLLSKSYFKKYFKIKILKEMKQFNLAVPWGKLR